MSDASARHIHLPAGEGHSPEDADTGRAPTESQPAANDEPFRAFFELAAVGMAECAVATGRFLRVNDAYCRILGYSAPELLRLTFLEITHPEDRESNWDGFQAAVRDGSPHYQVEKRLVRKDGAVIWARVNGRIIRDAGGRPWRMAGVLEDITERKRAEDELRKQKEILQKIFDHIPVMISFFDERGRLRLVNREWERTRGWTLEEVQRQDLGILFEDYPDPEVRRKILDFMAEASGEWADFKTRVRGGQMIDATWAVVRLSDGTRVSIGKDITSRKRAEEDRNQLMRRLITAQEDERRRISRELHDQMGQYLAALMLGLESLMGASRLPSRAQADLLYLKNLTEQFEQEVHRFASELRPTALDDWGLHPALSNAVEDWAKRYQNKVTVDFHSTGFADRGARLPPEIEATLYRVVQESLTNVFKHAGARRVSVILERLGDHVRVIVEDDGKGFDVEALMNGPVPSRRMGLTGIRERVQLVGGTLKIDSGAGTTVVVRIPLP